MSEYQYAKGDVVYVTNVGVCLVVGWARATGFGGSEVLVKVVLLEPVEGDRRFRGDIRYYPHESIEKVIASGPDVTITARRSARKYRVGELVTVDGEWEGVVTAAHQGEHKGAYDILRIGNHLPRPFVRVEHQRLSIFHGAVKVDNQGVAQLAEPTNHF